MKKSLVPIWCALGTVVYMTLALALTFFSSGMASTSMLVQILTVVTVPAWFALIFLTGALGMTTGWLNLPSEIGILIGIATYAALVYLVCQRLCRRRAP